jgi:hypothetical protein
MAWQVQFSVLKVGFLPEKWLKIWESEKLRYYGDEPEVVLKIVP